MLLSVVIPLYNGEKTIGKTLNSIYKQNDFDLNNVEIIICDDSSTDNGIDYIKQNWCDKLNIIFTKTKTREKHCPANTRADGMPVAIGDWITFIDCDDEFELNFFNNIFSLNIPDNIKVICGQVREWDSEQNAPIRVLQNSEFKSVLHGKVYNLQWLRLNNITFKWDMNFLEDMYFNICVENALIETNSQSQIISEYCYRWNKYITSYSRRYYGAHSISEYHKEYIIGFMYATIESYYSIYTHISNLDKKEFFKLQIMCNILHTYFYIQDCLYNNLFILEDYNNVLKVFYKIIEDLNKKLDITKDEICNYIYHNVDRYNHLKLQCKSGQAKFIELISFFDFIQNKNKGE